MQSSKAIPFIVKDSSNDTYHLTPQAEALLSTITTPLSVVTVAGLYRTGKSYLLNRVILNRSGGFGVGPTVNPCTKGLWVWGEPLSVGGRTVLVVDTEGLGALDEESNHDMKIFCLAVLLSSNFIYNSVGSIDETALQTLSLVLNLIAAIDTDSFSHRPSFLWVVRDFSLQLVDERGQQITASQYLQLALATEHLREAQKVQLRKTITDAFTERECFTLIKPLIDEQKLQKLDRVPPEELRPEFISQTIALRKYIMQSLREVKLGEAALRGSDYLLMCKRFLGAINSGAVPNLMDTWGYIREEKARQVVQQVRQAYSERLRNRLNNKLPMPANRLGQVLQQLRAEAEQEFLQLSYEQALSTELVQWLTANEVEMQRLNTKQSRAALNDILRREFEPFQKKLISGYYSDPSSYQQDLRSAFRPSIQEKFGDRLDLPLLELDLFTERRIVQGVKVLQKRSRQEATRAREGRTQAQAALQNEIRNLNKMLDQERRRMQEEVFQLQKRIILLSNDKQRAQEQLEKTKREEQAETGRLRRRTEEGQQQAEGLQRELIRLQSVAAQQDRQVFFLKKQLQKEKALSRQKEEHMEGKLTQGERRYASLQQQFQTAVKSWQNQKRDLLAHSESRLDQIMREQKEVSDHLAEVTGQLDHERFVAARLKQEIEALKERHQEDLQRFRQRCASSAKKEGRAEVENQYMRELQESRRTLQVVGEQAQQSELKIRQLQEQLKLQRSQSQKQEAIASQRIEFQQMENQQLRSKLSQLNSAYQRLFESSQSNQAQQAEMGFRRKISQLETEHAAAIKLIQNEWEARVAAVRKECTAVEKERDDAHLKISVDARRWQERERQMVETVQRLKVESEQLRARLALSEQGYTLSQREKESFYSERVRELQAQIERIKRQSAQQLQEIAHKSEETVAFIKKCSQQEKLQFQRRLEKEREKSDRKVAETNEEWSQRLNQEKEHLEAVIAELEANIEAMRADFAEQMATLKSDADIRLQKATNAALEERMDMTKSIALLRQEADITRSNLTAQLEERTRQYQAAAEAQKKQLAFECQQQIRAAKQAMEELQGRFDAVKKANRKNQESNLLLKSQLDREKAAGRQRDQASSRRLKQLEERFAQQLRNNSRSMEQLNEAHLLQTRKLNQQIERVKQVVVRLQTERTRTEGTHQQQRNALLTKVNYLQAKCKRTKDDYEDLLKKFQLTVRTLSQKNNSQNKQQDYENSLQRLREDYKMKLAEKESAVNSERKETHEKMARLQQENRSLRDKIVVLEMRQTQQSRYEPSEQYQKSPLAENKQYMDRNRSRYARQ